MPGLVRVVGNFHRRHAAVLAGFIELGSTDPVIEKVGKKHYGQTALDFRLLLLEHRKEFLHPDPERATDACFALVYGTLARYLGLGGVRDAVGEGDWKQRIEDLSLMCLAFLMTDLSQFKSRIDSEP